MLKQAAREVWRRGATAAVTAGMVGLVGATPAAADHRAVVNCHENPSALQTAIADAAQGETLWVKGTCTGPFTISKNLTLIGLRHAVLDGNYAGSTVTVTTGVRARLTNLTITHGSGTTVTGGSVGGGINNTGGTVTLSDSAVRHNTADFGGGISNTFSGTFGGTMTLTRSVVERNTARTNGGGIDNDYGSTMTLTRSAVRNNAANFGGGINNFSNSNFSNSTVTLSDSTVRHNTALITGGGINNTDSAVTLIHSTMVRNTAGDGPGSGGGINNSSGTVTLVQSRVRHNHPDNCAPPDSVDGCTG